MVVEEKFNGGKFDETIRNTLSESIVHRISSTEGYLQYLRRGNEWFYDRIITHEDVCLEPKND